MTDHTLRATKGRPWVRHTDDDYTRAAADLGRAIDQVAWTAQARHGIRFVTAPDAPNTYEALLVEAEEACRTGVLRVWDGASADTMYGTEGNYRFRAWHDLGHLANALSFTPDDERELQVAHHIPEIEAAGIEVGTLPWMLYVADTVGQIDHIVQFGTFPDDQAGFVRHLVATGEVKKF